MNIFKLLFYITIIAFLAAVGSAAGVELKRTPIQDWMSSDIALMSSSDFGEFDEVADEDKDKQDRNVSGGKRVSVAKAALYSALLPGLGEYYVGHRQKAKYFFSAEALTWISFFAFRTYGSWKEDDLIRLANEKASASLEGKDDDFLDWVGFYEDIDEFNTLGRVGDPDRPYLEDIPDNHWRWLSDTDQEAYRDLKNSSREAYRRSNFMIGMAVVNRVISVIDAVRDARRASRRIDDSFTDAEQPKYHLSIDPLNIRQQVTLTVYTPF